MDAVDEKRRDAVAEAFRATFGAVPASPLAPVSGGASGAAIFRTEVRGRPYLVRLDHPADAMRDPKRHYACMRIAAQAGVAPALHYADTEACVVIMDFIHERPLADHPGGKEGLARGLGALSARLHETATFPSLYPYPTLLQGLFARVRGSRLFATGLLDPHAEALARLAAAYPWAADAAVSSHNDPNARNTLFDGQRLWLVDWETAYSNDRFVDIAIHADQLEADPALETLLLERWLGRAPTPLERARLTVMRPLTRAYYAGLMLALFAQAPKAEPHADLSAPSPDEFRAGVAAGRLAIGAPETMFVLAKMLLGGFLAGADAPETERAADLLRGG